MGEKRQNWLLDSKKGKKGKVKAIILETDKSKKSLCNLAKDSIKMSVFVCVCRRFNNKNNLYFGKCQNKLCAFLTFYYFLGELVSKCS